jgi:hypothetical protein
LAGNLLHKSDLATLWGTLKPATLAFVGKDKAKFVAKLYSIIAGITGKEVTGDTPVIPATLARAGHQSRSPVLALTLQDWYTDIVNGGGDKLTSANYNVEAEWNKHHQVEEFFSKTNPLMGAPPKGWNKANDKLDSLENMTKRVQEGLEGFGDLKKTDAPLTGGDPRRPIFEFRSIGKGTKLDNLPNTALATWDYIALALGKAAGGPEKVEEVSPPEEDSGLDFLAELDKLKVPTGLGVNKTDDNSDL